MRTGSKYRYGGEGKPSSYTHTDKHATVFVRVSECVSLAFSRANKQSGKTQTNETVVKGHVLCMCMQ